MADKVVILWELGVLNYDSVVLDASLNETHRSSADVTSHPIETGGEASDHIIPRPDEVTIEGMLSNTPTIYLAGLRVSSNRAEQAYEKLLGVKEQGHLCYIFTTLREYESMALMSIEVPRNVLLGNVVSMRLTFRYVSVVESEIVDAPLPTMERAKPRKHQSRKAGKEPSLEVKDIAVSAALAGARLLGI